MLYKLNDFTPSFSADKDVKKAFCSSNHCTNVTLKVNDILISDVTVRAELFNLYFAAQCTPIDNSSKLPVFKYKNEHCLNSFEINEEDIY